MLHTDASDNRRRINAQNRAYGKTCDIKDPT